ncbi:MAG: biosynthetic arginine decarboxylase [Oligoflexia bacterium]|nr:biosynthetic arginine decarboxylase [Oligoflexia bacterium]
MESWDVSKSVNLYGISNWGEGYFDVNSDGDVIVRPNRNGQSINFKDIVRSLVQRGIQVPVLIRFDGIIRDRVNRFQQAFRSAFQENEYNGTYRAVFPVKVNQQRHVVDTIRLAGRDFGLGLEVGSKPELIAVLAMHDTPGALLLCNGYKDREYIELALVGRKFGRRSIIIIEQLSEIDQVLEIANQLGIEPELGLRMKPAAKGSGHWESSGGDKAKFGLTAPELVWAIDHLKKNGKDHWVKLLHFHVGSQITSITAIKKVLREATRMFTELWKLCPSLSIFDVGGGLAVDYDGSRTNFASSMDYTPEEYARDVVYSISQACQSAGIVQMPDIVTECGRALVAHHAVLVMQVVDVAPTVEVVTELAQPPSDNELLHEFQELHDKLSIKNCQESLHDAIGLREESMQRFINGDLSLREKAYADTSFWHIMAKVKRISTGMKYLPEDVERLGEELRDTYFCNFSVFQSLPDFWAVDQLFPIMPLQRLREEPNRRATLADMTCDSDGKIDRFIDLKDVNSFLNLHSVKSTEPYYLGCFLVGAYQEILGDLHNLFGDTNAVHVDLDDTGAVQFTHVVEGDTVREALQYVQFEQPDLVERLRISVEKALREGSLTPEEAAKIQKRYREALEGYTYLCVDP